MEENFFAFGIPGGVPMEKFKNFSLTFTFNISAKQRMWLDASTRRFALRDFSGSFFVSGHFAGLQVAADFELTRAYFTRGNFTSVAPAWLEEDDVVGDFRTVNGESKTTLKFEEKAPPLDTLFFEHGELDFWLYRLIYYPQEGEVLRLVNRTGGVLVSGADFVDASWSFDIVAEVAVRHTLQTRCYGTKQQ